MCQSQYDKIQTSINGAKAAGIQTLAPDQASVRLDEDGQPAKGFFIPPTVFVDVPKDAWIWQNEVFGPVLAVRSFTTEEEAVAEANSTRFGLASTVMSADPARAQRVANQIRAGAVYATSTGHGKVDSIVAFFDLGVKKMKSRTLLGCPPPYLLPWCGTGCLTQFHIRGCTVFSKPCLLQLSILHQCTTSYSNFVAIAILTTAFCLCSPITS